MSTDTTRLALQLKPIVMSWLSDAVAYSPSVGSAGGPSSPGAPTDAQYLALALNSSLSAERVFVPGSGLTGADGGANGNYTLSVGAGQGITVNADDVALASSTAGAGLTFSSGVLNVDVNGDARADLIL